MKKLFSILLVCLMLTVLLASCGTPVNTNTGNDTGTNTNTEDSNVTTVPEPEPKPNPKPELEPNPEPEPNPEQKAQATTWQFVYKIWWDEKCEPYTKLLVEDNRKLDIAEVVIPDDITAGDIITVEYIGSIVEQKSNGRIYLDGELISYSFEYMDVTHLSGDDFNIEDIKENYDYENAYVILDRYGRFTTLDEYKGNEIYLVSDRKRLQELGVDEGTQSTKYPIACMLAYNPRDLDDGANLRSQKVTIDLNDHHSIIMEDDVFFRYAGYVDYNENGNQYIKYAPNCYDYFALVSCNADTVEAWALIEEILEVAEINIELLLLDNNIMIEFPSFDAYSLVQEELLDGLSNLESVEKIEVDYIETNINNEEIKGYELYQNFVSIDCENIIIKTYTEFTELFDLSDDKNAELATITEQTFENNYLLFISVCCGHCADEIVITDVKFIDNILYFIQYDGYYTNDFHCEVAIDIPLLVVIPMSEIGTMIPEEFEIKTIDRDIYIENLDVGDTENDDKDLDDQDILDTLVPNDEDFPFDNIVVERNGYDIVAAGKYYGNDFDNVKDYGSYYRIIDNYNDFSELTAWGNKIDESVFEDNFVLVLYTYKNHDKYYSHQSFYHLHDRGQFDDFGIDKDTNTLTISESWSIDLLTPFDGPLPPSFYDYEIIIPTEKHEMIYLLIPKTDLKDELPINGEIELEIEIWESM